MHTLTIAEVAEVDSTGPTPDPATFAQAPFLSGPLTITMRATVAVDVTGPVLYNFTETTGNPGATSSDWQESPSFVDVVLRYSTTYRYTVQMRDATSPTPNTHARHLPRPRSTPTRKTRKRH